MEEESKAVERLHKTGGETNPWFGKRTMMVSQVMIMIMKVMVMMVMMMLFSQLQSEIQFLTSLT